MADSAFWEGFAKELSGVMRGFGGEILRRGEEKREEKRQIRREQRGVEAFGKKLEMQEPYEQRAHERLLARQKELAEYGMQLDMQREQNKAEYRAKLEGAYNDPAFAKVREQAAKQGLTGNTMMQAYVMLVDKEMGAVMRGEKDFDPKVAEGLTPLLRIRYNQAILENTIRERDYQMAKDQLQKQMLALEEQVAYHKTLQQQREDIGLTREINRAQDLEAPLAKAQKVFVETKRELMTRLSDENIINKKGEVTKGGKNLQLYNPETREFNEDAKARLLQYYPHYQVFFEQLEAVKAQLVIYEDMKERFKVEEIPEEKDEFGFKKGQRRTAPDNREYEYIGNNQWQLVK